MSEKICVLGRELKFCSSYDPWQIERAIAAVRRCRSKAKGFERPYDHADDGLILVPSQERQEIDRLLDVAATALSLAERHAERLRGIERLHFRGYHYLRLYRRERMRDIFITDDEIRQLGAQPDKQQSAFIEAARTVTEGDLNFSKPEELSGPDRVDVGDDGHDGNDADARAEYEVAMGHAMSDADPYHPNPPDPNERQDPAEVAAVAAEMDRFLAGDAGDATGRLSGEIHTPRTHEA